MSYYYDRDYIPTPAPEPPAVIPNPTIADNGKFLGVSDGEYSLENVAIPTPYIIETATNKITINTEIIGVLTDIKNGRDVWIKTTEQVTINDVTFNPFTAKVISVLNKKYGFIVNNEEVFYFIHFGSTGTFYIEGRIPEATQ